ncbi:MAG: hypothetical protein ACLTSX_08320 [Collinsella sp.]
MHGAEIDRRAAAGDPARRRRRGTSAGCALGARSWAACANMLDPTCMILSGSVVHQCGSGVRRGRHARGLCRAGHADLSLNTPIYRRELGGDAPLIGAGRELRPLRIRRDLIPRRYHGC